MPKKGRPAKPTKIEEAMEYARVAQSMAQHATISIHAQGILFESVIATLRETGSLKTEGVVAIFRRAAAVIDAMVAEDEVQEITKRALRQIVEQVALGFDVSLSHDNVSGSQRKH